MCVQNFSLPLNPPLQVTFPDVFIRADIFVISVMGGCVIADFGLILFVRIYG